MRLCHEPWLVPYWMCLVVLSPQCCRRWFLERTQRKTAWAWLRGVVLGFRVAASSHLSPKVALFPSHPHPSSLFFLSSGTGRYHFKAIGTKHSFFLHLKHFKKKERKRENSSLWVNSKDLYCFKYLKYFLLCNMLWKRLWLRVSRHCHKEKFFAVYTNTNHLVRINLSLWLLHSQTCNSPGKMYHSVTKDDNNTDSWIIFEQDFTCFFFFLKVLWAHNSSSFLLAICCCFSSVTACSVLLWF